MRPSCLTVAALMAVLLPASAQARQIHAASTLGWGPDFVQIQTAMDTPEPPDGHFAVNTTGCAWNDEDQILNSMSGDIAGISTDTLCIVADLSGANNEPYPKLLIGRVYVPKSSPLLSLSLTNDQGGSWTAGPPIPDGNQIVYQLCVADPVAIAGGIFNWQDLAFWPLVLGTSGYGQIVNYTIHLEAARTVHRVSAFFEAGFNGAIPGLIDQIQQLPPGEVPCPTWS